MISNITNKYQINYKPLTNAAPTFAGNKDILIIDEEIGTWQRRHIEEVLGDKVKEYKIHEAIGGKEGLKKAKKCKPFLTVTAYNMREWSPSGVDLIKALKKVDTKVIVVTTNWYRNGIESMKAGAKKCEEEAGADKYIYDLGFGPRDFKNNKDYELYNNHYSWDKVFNESVKAIIEGKPIPKYPFQIKEAPKQEKKDLLSRFIAIFWPDSKKETDK